MGAWGYGSDENDETYDALQGIIPDKWIGIKLIPEEDLWDVTERIPWDWYVSTPGVVMWHVKQGAYVPVSVMHKTIQDLENENVEGWRDATKRAAVITSEINLLKDRIETGNVTATGVFTFFEAISKHTSD